MSHHHDEEHEYEHSTSRHEGEHEGDHFAEHHEATPGDPVVKRGKWWNPLYRSEPMNYITITMGNETAPEVIRELGVFGKFHIEDLAHKEVQSKQFLEYKRKVREIETWEKRMELLERKIVDTYQLVCPDRMERPPRKQGDVPQQLTDWVSKVESELEPNEKFYTDTRSNVIALTQKILALKACRGWELPGRGELGGGDEEDYELKEHKDERKTVEEGRTDRIRSDVVGLITPAAFPSFNRMLYRVTRGNAFIRSSEISFEYEGETRSYTVFMVVVAGKDLAQRIRRMMKSFNAEIIDTPPTKEAYPAVITQLETELRDQRMAMDTTRRRILQLLRGIAGDSSGSQLREWQSLAIEEKAIADAMTKCQFYLTMTAIEGWVPTVFIPDLRYHVRRATEGTGHPPAVVECEPHTTIKQPKPDRKPTYFATDKYTSVFQGIVDTYGIPRYQEVNPGVFTIVTFPFLFGVMYGDIGHGCILTIASFMLIWNEGKLKTLVKQGKFLGEVGAMAYQGRYCLFLMGLFAIYCGTIYNDCMSIPLAIYKTAYPEYVLTSNTTKEYIWDGSVPAYGADWRWAHSINQLAFMNSFKMKIAVSLGVTHMIFGLFLGLANNLYFPNERPWVWLDFLPKIIFMTFTFGYMIFMIWFKWCTDWSYDGAKPPNLIQTMIYMFLQPGTVDDEHTLYSGQAGLQVFFVLCAVLCIPVMLLGKPCYTKHQNAKKHLDQAHLLHEQGAGHGHDEERGELGLGEGHEHKGESTGAPQQQVAHAGGEHEAHSFSDDMIHSSIHTIEFVLGAVSNTASYLRLWALSLAHSELAEVFWDKMIEQYGYESGNAFMTFVGFAVWGAATFGVLLSMDVLECFLHALRLHWVEFQSKFYAADGYAFDPFLFDYDPNGVKV